MVLVVIVIVTIGKHYNKLDLWHIPFITKTITTMNENRCVELQDWHIYSLTCHKWLQLWIPLSAMKPMKSLMTLQPVYMNVSTGRSTAADPVLSRDPSSQLQRIPAPPCLCFQPVHRPNQSTEMLSSCQDKLRAPRELLWNDMHPVWPAPKYTVGVGL